MQLYLTAGPENLHEAAAYQKPLVHAAYRIGEDSSLLSRDLLFSSTLPIPNGLLLLTDRNAPIVSQPERLADAVLRECTRRRYSGAVLDFESPIREDLRCLAGILSRRCAAVRRTLYLPEAYADAAERRIVIVNTAVSGGSLETYLQEICSQYHGAQNIALDIQCLRMDFSLPAQSGEGTPLDAEEFDTLLQAHSPAVFFSRDLCARYFTYSKGKEARFVLFDDAGTLRQKLRLGQQLGCDAAFFQWSEILGLAGELFPQVDP